MILGWGWKNAESGGRPAVSRQVSTNLPPDSAFGSIATQVRENPVALDHLVWVVADLEASDFAVSEQNQATAFSLTNGAKKNSLNSPSSHPN